MSGPQKKQPDTQDLLRAALEGDLARVRSLLEKGATATADSDDVAEALRRAENDNIPAGKFRTGLLETLVLHQQRGRINAAMYLAAFNGFDTVVDHFLKQSAQDQLTLNVALFAALRAGRAALAEKLMTAGADAGFKKGAPLRAAIDSGDADCVRLVLSHGAPRAPGLAHAASRGDMPMTALLVEKDDDIRAPLEKICQAVSDKRALPDKTRILDVQSVAEMLLALGEARGDDMQREIIWLGFTAAREGAAVMAEVIVRQKAFALLDTSDRRALLDVLVPMVFSGMQKSSHADSEKTLAAVIEAGGAQNVLESAVGSGNAEWTVNAIRAGADPRRNQGRALRIAEFLQEQVVGANGDESRILEDVRLSTAALSVMDEKRADTLLADPESLLHNLRRADRRRGTTGLMAVISAGRTDELTDMLAKTTSTLTAEDFLVADAQGYTALDRLADGGRQDWLFTPALWRGDAAAYHRLWDSLPESWRQDRQEAHGALLAALDVEAQQRGLHDAAEELSVKLPQRRKKFPH